MLHLILIPDAYSWEQSFYFDLHFTFDRLEILLRVVLYPWAFDSKYIWVRLFKWGNKNSYWSRDCKNIRGQNWRSKKICQFSLTLGVADSNMAELATLASDIFWPLYLQESTVPHLKDLFYIFLEPESNDEFQYICIILCLCTDQEWIVSVKI